MLAQTIDGRIVIDVTAAGHGWFVDATPSDDAEFGLFVSATEQIAPAGTEAAGHIDLLTVLMHEFGHVLGRADLPVDHASALMTATLPVATRRQPGLNPLDVNRDGVISPRDALLVINHLNSSGSGRLGDVADAQSSFGCEPGWVHLADRRADDCQCSELADSTAWRGRIGGTRGGVTDRRTH